MTPPRRRRGRAFRAAHAWVAFAIGACVLVCAAVIALHVVQDLALRQATTFVRELRQARIDLYQGFMHAMLGGAPESPWDRARGPVLMQQGVAELREALPRLPAEAARSLDRGLLEFSSLVGRSQAPDAREQVELRVAFYRLDQLAQQADAQARERLLALRRTQSRIFWLVLSTSILLLLVISVGVTHGVRSEAAATAARHESETRFRQLAESIREVFWLSDLDQQAILYVNPAYETIWGRPARALIEHPLSWLDAVHPGDREQVRARLAAQAEGHYDEEYRIVRPDGSERWIRDRAFPVRDAGGRVYRIAGVAEDITARRQAEARLSESERRLRDVIDLVPHAIYARDAEGRYLLANRATARRLQCAPDDLLGRRPEDLGVDAADAGRDREVDLEVLRTQRRVDGEVVRRVQGETVEFAFSKVPFSFGGSRADAVLGVSTDITELKRAQGRLKESVALLEATLQSTDNGVLVTGADGRLLHWNERLVQLLGGPAALRDGEEAAVLAALGAPDPSDGLPAVVERVGRRADGRFIECHAQPMAIDGRPAGRVWTFRDVTVREQAMAQAQGREQELEARVRERTQAMAQAYAELQSFSDAVSHDLRAPLVAIDAFAQALLRQYQDSLAPQAREYITRVAAAAANMKAMIQGLLELSQHARAPVHRRALDLSAMAREAYELHAGAAAGGQVEFRVVPGLQASGDPVLVATLLQNLVGNALKYSRHRDPARIEFGQGAEAGERYFFVRDNGAGFDPAQADRLFKPFSRLHLASEFEGHGIGLATASRIVARHGGRIWATGAPGEGATFCFRLE